MKFVFPVTLIVLNVCAGLIDFAYQDYRRGAYWILAAGINFVVMM